MTYDPNAIDEYTGLPFRVVRAMLDEAAASGPGISVTTPKEQADFIADVLARGRARDAERKRDHER